MMIPGIKPNYRYRVLPNGRMDRFDIFDLKTGEIVERNFSTQAEALEKIKALTDRAVSEEQTKREEITFGYS